ncbi:MAG: ATP-dependent DNA helicase [bacterium]|nr:ATP-dependent DNA helicase [bacterium]
MSETVEEAVKFELKIPVRALVDYSLKSGDLVSAGLFTGGDRAMEGIRAHQLVQESRPQEYTPEVTISHHVETDEFHVRIGGRMDGLYVYPDRVMVDEIKSTARNLEWFEEEENENPIHWGQAKVYAYIYALQNHLETIHTQLTYVNIDSKETKEFQRSFTLAELETFFTHLLTRYLHWASILKEWRKVRDESIQQLNFPFEVYRSGQREMALAVYRAIENSQQLMTEAPTGIGKTMATIFPTVKAMGNGLAEKFFYLTAKTTGRMIAQTSLDDLRAKGLKLKSLTLTAKDKICFNSEPGRSCNMEECEYAKGYYDRINEAVETVFQQDALTREVIEEGARQFNVCPFEFSLDLSLSVDGVICDYNYAFDPRVYLRRFFGEEAADNNFTFLVDEANNMVDRSREMFSAELFKQPLLDLRKKVKKDLTEVYRSLGSINSRMVEFKKECQEAGQPLAREDYPDDLSSLLRRFMRAAEQWLMKNIPAPYRQDIMDFYFQVNWFLKVADNYYEAYSFCLEQIDEDFRLKLFCIDPSQQMAEALDRSGSVVFFSATLAPMDYFRRILGCDPSTKEMIFPSPFPPENLCLAVADRISTLYKYRQRTGKAVAGTIDNLVKNQPGNYLVFFPSYRYMRQIYELFVLMNPYVERIVQTPGMAEEEREKFLDHFSMDNRTEGKTLVGFAVMGGIFGEGIDLVGDRLTGAVVVGVGLPGISLERELIKDYFNLRQDCGFEYAYLYPGMNRVFQAAGRVIRSDRDRGVVLLIGHRFTTHQYRSLFPYHWNPVRVQDEEHLAQFLDDFWNVSD